jgi:hypothetical protein
MSVLAQPVVRERSDVAAGDEEPGDVSIEIRRAGAVIVVTARGQLNRRGESLLDHLLGDLVVGQGNRTVIVDATSLAMADSAGRLFGRLGATAAAQGGQFTVHPSTDYEERLRGDDHH